MVKNLLFVVLLLITGTSASAAPFREPSKYNVAWQRLLLQLSSAYVNVVKENQVDLDSSLLYVSRSLGLSRLPVICEGLEIGTLSKKIDWIDKRDPAAALRLLPGLKGTEHLQLLVLLGAYYAFQPDAYHIYKDSVLHFLLRAREESKVLHEQEWDRQALCLLGKLYAEGNSAEQCVAVFKELTEECRAAGDLAGEAKALSYRGLYTAYSPATTKDRIGYLERARVLYSRLNEPAGEINALMDMGYLWVSNFQLDAAYRLFQAALSLEDSIGFPYTHYTTEAVAMVTTFEGKYGEPLKYALETARTAEAARDSIGWAYFYSRLGLLYFYDVSRDAESLKWMQKSNDRFILGGGDPTLYRNLVNLVSVMIRLGRPRDALGQVIRVAKAYPPTGPVSRTDYLIALGLCYFDLRQYDLAEKDFLEAAKLENQTPSPRGKIRLPTIIANLGAIYFAKGQYARAKDQFENFLANPYRYGNPTMIAYVLQHLYTIDSASGHYISAMRDQQQYQHLVDSLYKVSKLRQAEELGVQYETAKKESEIELKDQDIRLLNQTNQLQRANLEKATLIKKVTFWGILLLLVIFSLLFRQYRLKQRNNLVITQKNELLQHLLTEKEWLLKEVHHRVKNNLHTVICLLESQAAYLENDAFKALENSKHRIYAMSLIHQKLYQSADIKAIDMEDYINDFVRYLTASIGAPGHIRFQLDIDPVKLGVSQAIPLGLIINEAVTNSIKYAFPENRSGVIKIGLHQITNQIELVLEDDGIGIQSDIKKVELNSLGIELMRGLAEDISGRIRFETNQGTKITVTVDVDPLNDPANLAIWSAERRVYA